MTHKSDGCSERHPHEPVCPDEPVDLVLLAEGGSAGDGEIETTPIHDAPGEVWDAEDATYLGADHCPRDTSERSLADFTATPSILRLVPLGIGVGVLAAGISLALLSMIGFFTNLFYYQRLSFHLVSPNANTLGAIAVVIPIGGGLIVGLIARFGSEHIRGHGIPEAMENILPGRRCAAAAGAGRTGDGRLARAGSEGSGRAGTRRAREPAGGRYRARRTLLGPRPAP